MARTFRSIELGRDDEGRRLDRIARKVLPGVPLGRVYSAIRSGDIRLNGKKCPGDTRVREGDTVGILDSLAGSLRLYGHSGRRSPRGLPASRVVFESAHLLVVNKQRGELVHGPDSLTSQVVDYLGSRPGSGVSFRPGPIHRLDRNTTGLIMFAASLRGAQEVARALRDRQVEKAYVAVLQGRIDSDVVWADSLMRDSEALRTSVGDGVPALSRVSVVASEENRTLAIVRIASGRTHQIRAHAAHHGTPLLGDRKYGAEPLRGGHILHAGRIAPNTPWDCMPFSHLWVPLPEPAANHVELLFGKFARELLYERLAGGGLRPTVY